MKPASESGGSGPVVAEGGLAALLARLEALASDLMFEGQRQLAMSRAFRLYALYGDRVPLKPLADEVALAELYVFADFYPEDGQLSLIEQVRDMVDVHVPEEERLWLDPLRHSFMDLLDVVSIQGEGPDAVVTLRSLGDGRQFRVAAGDFRRPLKAGQAVLTRLIRMGDRIVCPGPAVVLSASAARSIFKATEEWRREMEAQAGSFELGEWEEFAKRYGYVLLWNLAQARLDALAEAEARFQFRTPSGAPYLFALALYDHHEHRFLDEGLAGLQGWEVESPEPGHAAHSWVQRERSAAEPSDGATAIVGRLILTPSQLMVECDSRKRLDLVKHELATAFGFSLHFRGECAEAPFHRLLIPELDEEESPAQSRVVTPDEEHRLLSGFLETVYLEWADLPCPALDGQTPRHAAATPETRHKVAALIDEIERNDPGLRRTGKPAYDYNRLRAHVGLEEGA